MTIETAKLGLAIKQVRSIRGLTQVALAAAAGLSKSGSSIALIEQGRRSVSVETLNAIASALNIPAGCLAIMGTATGNKNPAASDLLDSVRELITSLLEAEEAVIPRPHVSKRKATLTRPASTATRPAKSKVRRQSKKAA